MQSAAPTVEAYLDGLPPDRAAALSAVREVILANLDAGFQEAMAYGMIGYSVPHAAFPAGYHCDPKQPLPYAGLASQKGHMSIYLMSLYGAAGGEVVEGGSELLRWFQDAWAKTGKKLDMGKSCIRFKRVDELALDVIAETLRRVPASLYMRRYLDVLAETNPKAAAKVAKLNAKAGFTAP